MQMAAEGTRISFRLNGLKSNMAIPRLTDEEYRFVYSRTPRLCIDLLIVFRGGVVLVKREIPPYAGLWHLPGGRMLYKESIDEAIARIAKAEANLEVNIKEKKLIGYMEFQNDGEFVHSVSIVFRVEAISEDMKGSEQGRTIEVFKELPEETHPIQRPFLKNIWKEIV